MRHRFARITLVWAGVSGGTGACAHHAHAPEQITTAAPDTVLEVADYEGIYQYGFEVSRFTPCGAPPSERGWWVIPGDEAMATRDSLAKLGLASSGQGYHVRFRGVVSARTMAGHMGRYSRYFTVTQILDWKPVGRDCPDLRQLLLQRQDTVQSPAR